MTDVTVEPVTDMDALTGDESSPAACLDAVDEQPIAQLAGRAGQVLWRGVSRVAA
jgi:hypothetical protein